VTDAEDVHARPGKVPHAEVVLPWRAPRRRIISATELPRIRTSTAKRPSHLAGPQIERDHRIEMRVSGEAGLVPVILIGVEAGSDRCRQLRFCVVKLTGGAKDETVFDVDRRRVHEGTAS
jgi:hypothetical protein